MTMAKTTRKTTRTTAGKTAGKTGGKTGETAAATGEAAPEAAGTTAKTTRKRTTGKTTKTASAKTSGGKAATARAGTAKTAASKTTASDAPARKATTRKTAAGKTAASKTAAGKTSRARSAAVIDETAPGRGPVTVSATEARAAEPVMTDEGALAADTPPPAGTPAPTDHSARTRERASEIHDGETPVQADTTATHSATLTGDAGEPEHNAAAHVPAAGERTEDGKSYAEVAHPANPTERMQKRELELGADMDYVEHRKTYSMFLEGAKWGTAIIIGLLIAMAVGFFTAGGVMGGLVMFLGALLAGYWFLR